MDAKTRKALEGSIRKWRKIVKGTGVDEGVDNCPLCHLFFYGDGRCEGCPVMERSKMPGCDGTPYMRWADTAAFDDDADVFLIDDEASRTAAQAELDFLISLRPKKVKKAARRTG